MPTNTELIREVATTIYSEEELKEFDEVGEIPLHTLNGWKQKGFYVKKGEHGIETKLWKKKNNHKPNPITRKINTYNFKTTSNTSLRNSEEFVLVKSFLFTQDQVEKAQKQNFAHPDLENSL